MFFMVLAYRETSNTISVKISYKCFPFFDYYAIVKYYDCDQIA